MTATQFATLVAQIEREFGVSIPVSPLADVSSVPEPLRDLYRFSDGLTLPFASIDRFGDCDRTTYPNWICFGSDRHFSCFLCHVSESPALTTWDHEAGQAIAGVYHCAVDWLTAEYEEFVEADTCENTVHVTEVPDGVSKPAVIAEIKKLSDESSSEILGRLRSRPFAITNVVRSHAFQVVRKLHRYGVSCHVECDA